jgi:hypothetical protein
VDKTTTRVKHGRVRQRAPRILAVALAGGLLASLTVLGGDSARAIVFGSSDTLTLQNDTASLTVIAIAGKGGNSGPSIGGAGARVQALIPAEPGETITITVGQNGTDGAASMTNSTAGTGGGLSGVRSANGTRRVVAGGGGGAAGQGLLGALLGAGGNGGTGSPTSTGPSCGPGAPGADGGSAPPVAGGGGGGGGSCSAGGAGGTGVSPGTAGMPGAGGQGGGSTILGGDGGDGGQGFFGGGGGGGALLAGGGGGGGGGSSFVQAGAANVAMQSTAEAPVVEVVENDFPVPGTPQCSDNVDNDGDGDIDDDDDGCHTDGDATDGDDTYNPNDNDETDEPDPTAPECSDNIDNDADDDIDDADNGCHTDNNANDGDNTYNPDDDDESEVNPDNPQCSDGVDNDNDNDVDDDDDGCHTDGDADDDDNTFDPTDDDESNNGNNGQEGPRGDPSCSDGIDNDGDGLIDANDPGCLRDGDGDGGGGADSDLVVTLDLNKNKVVKAGKTVGATVTVRNLGPGVARNIEVVTKLDKGRMRFKSVIGNGCTAPAPSSNIVVCRITTLPVAQSVNFTIEAKTKGRGKARVETQAFLTDGEDRAPSDNVDRETIKIKSRGKGRRR